MKKKERGLSDMLRKTVERSPCTYRISAIALDKKGDVLGIVHNGFRNSESFMGEQGRKGTGLHAEARLIRRYGQNIKTILIMRIGNSGNVLPIDPCPACAKMADKLGINVLTTLGKDDLGK